MLPPPQSSCAGWWFSRLWRALLAQRPERHAIWRIDYPGPDEVLLRPFGGAHPLEEVVGGTLREAEPRRMLLHWEWPGEDGMLHLFRGAWEVGQVVVRPLDWVRSRRPHSDPSGHAAAGPWPLHLRVDAHGWHGQTLERAEIQVGDGLISYPLRWDGRHGEPRTPLTEIPSAITSLGRHAGEESAALTLAGLTLPWRIDLDYDAWAVWRRLSADQLLYGLGGPTGVCPRHGAHCPWPAAGSDSGS